MNTEKDLTTIMEIIEKHQLKAEIVEFYKVGPGENGFMWCKYNTPAKKYMHDLVLDMGYDSSGFAWMHRAIQARVNKKYI